MEKVTETKICKCGNHFDITDKDLEFYEKISPVFNGEKYLIPSPTLCPDCRLQRRLSFRNERKLYKRTCDATGKDIISIYSPDKPYKVYNQKDYWTDKLDSRDYGRPYDFSRPFFEQFEELMRIVPLSQLTTEYRQQENCEYTNSAGGGKNCYLSFEWAFCENMCYSKSIWDSNDLIDCSYCNKIQDCYECIDSNNCYNCKYTSQCDECSYSEKLYNCRNCHYCINCFGLENKKYHINNKDYGSLEGFLAAKDKIKLIKLEIEYLPNGKFYGNENVEKGFNVINSKNCKDVSNVSDLENCKHCSDIFGSKDCQDFYSWGENTNMCYEIQESGGILSNSAFMWLCWGGVNRSFHCFYCVGSISDCFGCIGLKSSEYCILNKQYTKEEYEALVPKIIEHMKKTGEWGEFFPSSISPFGYNETVASEHFPLNKEKAISSGFKWSDYENPTPQVAKIISASKLPENIKDIPDDILNWAIECEVTNKPFRIIKQELDFYRKHNIPIPRQHPDERHLNRMKQRKPKNN